MPHFKASRRVAVPATIAYEVASDVHQYKEFLPLLEHSTIRGHVQESAGQKIFHAELSVGYAKLNLRETFISRVVCNATTHTVTATTSDAPFRDMRTIWTITEAGEQADIAISIDYTMRSMLLQFAVTAAMDMAVSKVMAAFEARAIAIYKASMTI